MESYLIWALQATMLASMTGAFSFVDRAFRDGGYTRPYYAVHVLHNLLMMGVTVTDVWWSFTHVNDALTIPVNWFAALLCFALHFYHIKDYWRSFHSDDWLHHSLMIGIALPLGLMVPAGSLLGLNLFFTTGLPGAISYAVMFAERNGWIQRATEKRWSVIANVWLRSPGCAAHAALATAVLLSCPTATWGQQLAGGLIAALTYWNGQYFMQQAVEAAVRARLNIVHPMHTNTRITHE